MDESFFAYLQQLELLAFFSGYPLIYAIVFFVAGNKQTKYKLAARVVSILPFAYALIGTLYLGFQLKKLYPDYSFENIRSTMLNPYLAGWALLSLLFWIPAISKTKIASLIHSLVFFIILIRDLFLHLTGSSDKSIVSNDMKVYSTSLLLNLGAVIVITLLSFFFLKNKKIFLS